MQLLRARPGFYGIDDVLLRLRDGDTMLARAQLVPVPIGRVEMGADDAQYRWMRERGTLHIPDVNNRDDSQIESTKPTPLNVTGWRTFLAVPLWARNSSEDERPLR